MPEIVYNGRTYALVTVRYTCLLCGTLAESSSTHPHSLVSCSCGELNVDGGIAAGGTITGDPAKMEDLSVYRTRDEPIAELPLSVLAEWHARVVSRIGLR